MKNITLPANKTKLISFCFLFFFLFIYLLKGVEVNIYDFVKVLRFLSSARWLLF